MPTYISDLSAAQLSPKLLPKWAWHILVFKVKSNQQLLLRFPSFHSAAGVKVTFRRMLVFSRSSNQHLSLSLRLPSVWLTLQTKMGSCRACTRLESSPKARLCWGKLIQNSLTCSPQACESDSYFEISRVSISVFLWAFWSTTLGKVDGNGKIGKTSV